MSVTEAYTHQAHHLVDWPSYPISPKGMTSSQILVLNPDPDNLDKVLAKANLQHAKNGPFEAVLLLGDVLPQASTLPTTDVSVPTYFTVGKHGLSAIALQASSGSTNLLDVKENFTLAKSNICVLSLALGVTIMLVSATVETERSPSDSIVSPGAVVPPANRDHAATRDLTSESDFATSSDPVAKSDTVTKSDPVTDGDFARDTSHSNTPQTSEIAWDALPSSIDILCTYNWPKAIANDKHLTLVGNPIIDEIVKRTRPRYHFAVGHERGIFYEALPFVWGEDNRRATRFISLAQEGTQDKWFYAFTLDSTPPAISLKLVGRNPFTDLPTPNRRLPVDGSDSHTSKRRLSGDEPDLRASTERPTKAPKVVAPSDCFFCLSNPKVESHMIVSIGASCYVAIAKGPLPKPSRTTGFLGHAIIIPIEHVPTFRSLGDVRKSAVFDEVFRYQKAFVSAFLKSDPASRLVFFETSRATGVHQGIQFLPVPLTLLAKFEDALQEKVDANNNKYTHNHPLEFTQFDNVHDLELQEIIARHDYLCFTIFDEIDRVRIFISKLLDAEKAVDFQFARRVLASVLRCNQRVYWSKCQQPKIKEQAECEALKAFFKDHDFTLE